MAEWQPASVRRAAGSTWPIRQETRRRAIVKSLTYRLTGLALTVGISYAVTGRSDVAASIGAIDTILKLLAFYGHERVWTRISFGRDVSPQPALLVSEAGGEIKGAGDE